MKRLSIILFFLTSLTVFPQPKQDTTLKSRLHIIENNLSNIEKKNYENEIINLKEKIDFQQKMIEQSSTNISNQLDSASYNLTLFGLLFTIGAIGVGIYVTYIEGKIVKIREENKTLLTQNQKIKEDVEAINKLIQNDIYNLFLKIKREESIHILDRLIKVPQDITHVCSVLLSRELHEEDFEKIRQAYFNLETVEKSEKYQIQYYALFFQHFLVQSLNDEKIRQNLSSYIPSCIAASFENDIIKSTSDFAIVLVNNGILSFKHEINLFFMGLTNSSYRKHDVVYQLLFNNLKSRKNRFDTFNVIESIQDNRQAKIEFGNLLKNAYATDNPSKSELLVYSELEELLTAQKNADEEEMKKKEEQKQKQEEIISKL